MQRNIISQLIHWKNGSNRKPLILNGARQVGKTWALKEFGKTEYPHCVYFNCDQNERLKEVFSGGYDIPRIIKNLEALCAQKIEPSNTLLIFDEAQENPNVLTALKYFFEEAPTFHIATAGSLLGLSLHQGSGFPVGKVDLVNLYPMNFFEFVQATKGERLVSLLKSSRFEELGAFHTELKDLLRQYYCVGGMPEAVLAFTQNKSFDEIRTIQNAILFAYEKDISKHAKESDVQKIHLVWQNIPFQLAKENKKFIYNAIKKGGRAKDFENAIQWLIDAGLIYKVNRIKKPAIPLKFYEDFDSFKLFFLDCGLMAALSETPASQMVIGDNIFEEYKGAYTEQFVFQELRSVIKNSVFYFAKEDSSQELDFLLQKEANIIPIEVKAEENLRAKSLRQFVLENPACKGIRFSMSPYREQDWMTNIPLYLAQKAFL